MITDVVTVQSLRVKHNGRYIRSNSQRDTQLPTES